MEEYGNIFEQLKKLIKGNEFLRYMVIFGVIALCITMILEVIKAIS